MKHPPRARGLLKAENEEQHQHGVCVCWGGGGGRGGTREACVSCEEGKVRIQFIIAELTLGLEGLGNPLFDTWHPCGPALTLQMTSSWYLQRLSRNVQERVSR